MNFIGIANEFLLEGFNPLPLKENKAPKLPEGHPYLYERMDKVDRLFANCSKIGIACGTISGGFYCFDFDCHGKQNIKPIGKEFHNSGLVQMLLREGFITGSTTPSGGYHYYFKYNKEIPGTALARWSDKETMIEIRGNGQYVATYPSEGYKFFKGVSIAKLETISDDIFNALTNLCRSYDQLHEFEYTDPQLNGKSDRKWPDKWDSETLTGKFNNESADIVKQLLTDNGWRYMNTRRTDGVELWQRPGKELDDGISATFGVKFNMFYNFSENAMPIQVGAHSPFDLYTTLKFNGDWKKAKDSLKPTPLPEPEPIQSPHSFFPIEVFPQFVQDHIKELNKSLNFHIDFSAAAAMFTVATINGNKYKLRVKNGWEAPTIFWFACVGYPGTIKTHPVKTMTKPLTHIDTDSKHFYDKEMAVYNPEAKQKTPKPKFRQMLISDYTIESLHTIHDINPRGLGLYKDELKGFLNDMNKYRKGSDEEFWLESFNNGSYIVNRVTKEPVMVNNICINIIGTMQHEVLNKVITEYAGNGLIDRFLFTSSEATVYPISTNEIDNYYPGQWEEFILKADNIFKYDGHSIKTEVLTMCQDTFLIYQKIDAEYVQMQNSEDYSQEIKNYLSKMKTYVPRFALLLAIMDTVCDGIYLEVKPHHMVNAKKIADYFVKTATNVFNNNSSQSEIKSVESSMKGLKKTEKIIKLYQKKFSQAEIAKYFSISQQAVSKVIKNNPQ